MIDPARFLVALSLCAPGVASAQPAAALPASGLKPGSWEISTVIASADASMQKTVTSRVCYSPEDVAAPERVLPPQRGLGVQCLASDVKSSGTVGISWKLACNGKVGSMNGSGTMKPGPGAYSAEVRLERKGAKAARIDETITGKWVGTCP